jgi:hypothetical protein
MKRASSLNWLFLNKRNLKVWVLFFILQTINTPYKVIAQESNTVTYTVLLKRGEVIRLSDKKNIEKNSSFKEGSRLKFSSNAKMLVLDDQATTYLVEPNLDLVTYNVNAKTLALNVRRIPPHDYPSLQEYFSDTLLVLGDQIFVPIAAEGFPINSQFCFFLSYNWAKEPQSIIKKDLSQNSKGLFLIKEEIFKVDENPVSPNDVSNYQLHYRNKQTQENTLINDFFLIFPDNTALIDATSLIVEKARGIGLTDEEIFNKVLAFIVEAYAEPDEKNFYSWMEKVFHLSR